ncbi:MAG: YggT family protein [Chloroflexi bacterium]|nr:YggT family protein [Chloroflexota bacterium]
MIFFLRFVDIFTQVLTIAIVARALLSWFPVSRHNPLVEALFQITEPMLAPLRRIVPTIGMIDITPLVAMLLLQMVNSLVAQLAYPY